MQVIKIKHNQRFYFPLRYGKVFRIVDTFGDNIYVVEDCKNNIHHIAIEYTDTYVWNNELWEQYCSDN